MQNAIEIQIANQMAHSERIAKNRARTDGEQMHVDHYDFRQDFRDMVLSAMDEACERNGMPKVMDKDLPNLFRALDPLAERLWLRRCGLE